MFKIIFIVMSWILVGFISWLFLIISYLRKSKYNPRDLKEIEIGVFIMSGWFSPIIILLCYMTYKFESKKYNFQKWIYDILYKIANIGVDKKSNKKEKERSDKDEII